MPDVFADITAAPPPALEMISNVLELRASIPQQQEMLRTYLRDIEFPDRAKVLEIGCGTGAITRALASWPNVGEVLGVDPSPYLVDKARVETAKPGLTVTWVDRGADVLASRGRISQELAGALKAEARCRAKANTFFGYMAYASMIGRKPQ